MSQRCEADDAGSPGGYYIAAAAQTIIAHPLTLTSSIGIFSGKLAGAGLMDKLGLGRYAIGRGRYSGLFSTATPFTPGERQRVRAPDGL